MGRLVSVTFRGGEHDVHVTSQKHPNEPEWRFYGLTTEQHDALAITDAEDNAITQQVWDALYDDAICACPEDF